MATDEMTEEDLARLRRSDFIVIGPSRIRPSEVPTEGEIVASAWGGRKTRPRDGQKV